MRPLLLTMQAFGPYRNKQTVDFLELKDRLFFVISGKTGAGKTSIFDAMCFALYGKATSDDRSGMELRSHYAPIELPTEVTFTFQLRQRIYKVVRSPQQELPKKTGDGFTTKPAKATLYELVEGRETLLGSMVKDVDELIRELVGLQLHQFRQLLCLPQGEFKKLLVSDSREKEAILEKLFSTELYKNFSEELFRQSSQVKEELRNAEEKKTRALGHFQYNEGDRFAKWFAEGQQENWTSIYEGWLEETKQLVADKEEAGIAAGKALEQSLELLQRAKHHETQKKAYQEASDRLLLLQNKKEEQAERKQFLQMAGRSQQLLPYEESWQKAKSTAEKRKQEKELLQTKKEKVEASYSTAQKIFQQEQANEHVREASRQKRHRLEDLKTTVEKYQEHTSNLQRMQSEQEQVAKQYALSTEKISNLKQQIDNKRVFQEQLQHVREETFASKEFLHEQSERLALHEQAVQAERSQKETDRKLKIATTELQSLQQHEKECSRKMQQLLKEKQEEAAYELRIQLEDGKPCPVCGSLHHPAPVHSAETTSQSEEIELLQAEHTAVLQEIKEAEREVTILQTDLAHFEKARMDMEIDVVEEELQTELRRLRKIVKSARKKLANDEQTIETLQINLNNLQFVQEEYDKNEASIEAERIRLESCEKELSVTEAVHMQLKQQLPDGVNTLAGWEKQYKSCLAEEKSLFEAYKQATEHFEKEKASLEKIATQVDAQRKWAEEAEQEFVTEDLAWKDKRNTAGFSSDEAYLAAKKLVHRIPELEHVIKEYEENVTHWQQRVAALNDEISKDDAPEVAVASESVEKCRTEWKQIEKQLTQYRFLLQENAKHAKELERIEAEVTKWEQQYRRIGHLADMARGQNAKKISFERYVLAAMFEGVLHASNERLLLMTNGRYRLLRNSDRAKGTAQSGLELLVDDQYTGRTRHVKTLSGGESFKASLALALGLSDVVQSYAGGVSLETMFIDEGFGTLDPESLDQALETLFDLQASGRLVGVISHVPELKNRVDLTLEVTSTPQGSTVDFVHKDQMIERKFAEQR
ncbi:AAA family ATPase [Bacillus fonticola]|uniref:AAA family ATPase n=1 Tax=Bacillus fonticola TaxID=2728853 RepID=UPI001474255F|nr:SMC family ATPase [Bacillus fonticola]